MREMRLGMCCRAEAKGVLQCRCGCYCCCGVPHTRACAPPPPRPLTSTPSCWGRQRTARHQKHLRRAQANRWGWGVSAQGVVGWECACA